MNIKNCEFIIIIVKKSSQFISSSSLSSVSTSTAIACNLNHLHFFIACHVLANLQAVSFGRLFGPFDDTYKRLFNISLKRRFLDFDFMRNSVEKTLSGHAVDTGWESAILASVTRPGYLIVINDSLVSILHTFAGSFCINKVDS